jgi:hypothetical protein
VVKLTVAAGLNRGLNVADGLNGNAVLVVAIDVLVLELTNLVDQYSELICDVRHVVVTGLAPDGKLLLKDRLAWYRLVVIASNLTATSIRSRETSSMLRITFFSILTSCESFFARSGPKAPADLWRKVWPGRSC